MAQDGVHWYNTQRLLEPIGCAFYLFIRQPHGSEVSPAARNTLDSARIPRASKLLICGLFQKGGVLAQDAKEAQAHLDENLLARPSAHNLFPDISRPSSIYSIVSPVDRETPRHTLIGFFFLAEPPVDRVPIPDFRNRRQRSLG